MPAHVINILTRYSSTYHAKTGKGKSGYKATCTASEEQAAKALLTKWYGGKGIDTLRDTKAHEGDWRIWQADVNKAAPVEVQATSNTLSTAPKQPLQETGKPVSDQQITESLDRADQAGKEHLMSCLIAGATLSAAKASTPHGQWTSRVTKLTARCQFGYTTCRVYMQLWKAFIIDLDKGQIMTSRNNSLDISEEQLLAIPENGKLDTRVKSAIRIWLGEEGTIRGVLDRIGRAERDAARAEDEAARVGGKTSSGAQGGGSDEPPANQPTVQSSFEDTLFNDREGLLTKLRSTLNADAYTTLPKSEWQRAFGEIEPLYQLLKERSGF